MTDHSPENARVGFAGVMVPGPAQSADYVARSDLHGVLRKIVKAKHELEDAYQELADLIGESNRSGDA